MRINRDPGTGRPESVNRFRLLPPVFVGSSIESLLRSRVLGDKRKDSLKTLGKLSMKVIQRQYKFREPTRDGGGLDRWEE